MDGAVFRARFQQAVITARDFARMLIEEPLPDDVRCRLSLNSSYDGNPLIEDETVFPEDSTFERIRELATLTLEEAAAVLWRSGKVPEWINVAVVTRTERRTIVAVDSCGRFTANEDLLYHVREGRPPFHVLGPASPWNYVEGEPFSIYACASCRTSDEFASVRAHSARPWSLELSGPDFDDDALSAAGPFPALEILELKGSPVRGPGLSACSQMPKLRIIRVERYPLGQLSLAALPTMDLVDELTLSGLSEPPALAALESATPALARLSLEFTTTEVPVEIPRIASLTDVTITADHLCHDLRFPDGNQVRDLSIHGSLSDGQVLAILEQLPLLTALNLSGTNVTDETARFLSRYTRLTYLCLQKTNVSSAGLEALRAQHPRTRIHG